MVQGITAIHCLELANAQPKDTILVHAAAGGVGTLAIQIAAAHGHTVLGTASNAEKCAQVEKLGGTPINYVDEDWVARVLELTDGRGADVILESVGGDIFQRSFHDALADFGRMIVFGCASSDIRPVQNVEILASNKTLTGYYLGSYIPKYMDRVVDAIGKLLAMVQQGKVSPIVGKSFSLDDAAAAFDHMQSRKSIGKVIVNP